MPKGWTNKVTRLEDAVGLVCRKEYDLRESLIPNIIGTTLTAWAKLRMELYQLRRTSFNVGR